MKDVPKAIEAVWKIESTWLIAAIARVTGRDPNDPFGETWRDCGDNRTMHNYVARTLATVVAWAAMAAVPASLMAQGPPDTIAQHLIALEQQWNDAILRNDRTAAAAFMAEEWTEITSDGSVLTRAEDLDELVGGYHATSLRLSDIAVHIYDNAAVVSGTSDEQSSYRGKDTSGRFRWMDVWVRRAGRWECVASTVARITRGRPSD